MIKKGCENVSPLLILLIFYFKSSQKSNLSLDNTNLRWGEISLWNKCFSQIHVGHKYWHPKKFLWVKYLWSIFSFIFTILSTPGWLWTWNYAAMASCFTEIYIFLAMTVHARTACNAPKTKWNLKSHHMTPLSFVITAGAWSIVFENYCQ